MRTEELSARSEELLSYVIASGDMRFIEIGERILVLRHSAGVGAVICGGVPGYEPHTYIDLSRVLLEYVMGCGDCREAEQTRIAAERFGQRLGVRLAEVLKSRSAMLAPADALANGVMVVLSSLGSAFDLQQAPASLSFALASCPLHTTAEHTGFRLYVGLAHLALCALLAGLAEQLAPEWTLVQPDKWQTDAPLTSVRFARR